MILDRILASKHDEVAAKEAQESLTLLSRRAAAARPPRDFAAALRAPGMSAIAEIKFKSPSKGIFRQDFDPISIARSYVTNGARALSILADRTYFGGGCDIVAKLASHPDITVPILFKEFVVSPYQIFEARAAGADGVLLIARALDEKQLGLFIRLIRSLGMEALVETFTEPEVLAAVRAGARIIGVNNRDLASFTVDLDVSRRLRAAMPPDTITVSESGLRNAADVASVGGMGYDAILVGEALLVAADPGKALADLLQPAAAATPSKAESAHRASATGYFGQFGGQYSAETLMGNLTEFEQGFLRLKDDPSFVQELEGILRNFVGRPTPLTPLKRLSAQLGGATLYAKREDLTHTGAHKINNAVAQALLAKRLGKERIVAETGAGQHGVATATACALLGLACTVYMGAVDAERQAMNVQRMKMLGADLRLVHNGQKTLKDAISEALRDWTANVANTHYLLGSAVGPHPFPSIVKHFQSVIGQEARAQIIAAEGRLPDYVIACVGGGSNAIGAFAPFFDDRAVRLIGVQAAGEGLGTGRHAAPLVAGRVGILQGFRTYVLTNDDGQIEETHSIAPGLDYPGVGPEHAYLRDTGRASYVTIDDQKALEAFGTLCRLEGILPALESSHAIAYAMSIAGQMAHDTLIMINLSGRGDKDLASALAALEHMGDHHAQD